MWRSQTPRPQFRYARPAHFVLVAPEGTVASNVTTTSSLLSGRGCGKRIHTRSSGGDHAVDTAERLFLLTTLGSSSVLKVERSRTWRHQMQRATWSRRTLSPVARGVDDPIAGAGTLRLLHLEAERLSEAEEVEWRQRRSLATMVRANDTVDRSGL